MTYAEVYRLLVSGEMTYEEFEDWMETRVSEAQSDAVYWATQP